METTNTKSEYASFWRRAGAAIIDGIILSALVFIVGMVLDVSSPSINIGAYLDGSKGDMFTLVLGWFYFSYMESSPYQATIGKQALDIKVTHENGERISFARASGRYFAEFISGLILGIGYLMMFWTKKHQTLHDKIVKTLVVNAKD